MYKKLLVPLDGSSRAEQILPHTENMARRHEAEVILIQIVDPPMMVQPGILQPDTFNMTLCNQEYERLIHDAEHYLEGVKARLIHTGIPARKIVSTGPVVEAIIEIAETENVDLICIASHGRSGLARVFYGSVAAGILHRVDRPLLLIRAEDLS